MFSLNPGDPPPSPLPEGEGIEVYDLTWASKSSEEGGTELLPLAGIPGHGQRRTLELGCDVCSTQGK